MSSRGRRERAMPAATDDPRAQQRSVVETPWWASGAVQVGLLAMICVAVYANNFRHEYFLDDAHVLESNLSIR